MDENEFEYLGVVYVSDQDIYLSCSKCAFVDDECALLREPELIPSCSASSRKDKMSVTYKRKQQ